MKTILVTITLFLPIWAFAEPKFLFSSVPFGEKRIKIYAQVEEEGDGVISIERPYVNMLKDKRYIADSNNATKAICKAFGKPDVFRVLSNNRATQNISMLRMEKLIVIDQAGEISTLVTSGEMGHPVYKVYCR